MFIFVYYKSPRWISTGNPPEFHRKSTGNPPEIHRKSAGNPPEMIPEKGRNLLSFGVWTCFLQIFDVEDDIYSYCTLYMGLAIIQV